MEDSLSAYLATDPSVRAGQESDAFRVTFTYHPRKERDGHTLAYSLRGSTRDYHYSMTTSMHQQSRSVLVYFFKDVVYSVSLVYLPQFKKGSQSKIKDEHSSHAQL